MSTVMFKRRSCEERKYAVYETGIYRVIQESIFWKVMVLVVVRKKFI
jgi:hypothetical protein